MVSIGSIISLAVVGAVAAGGYALYRNANKVRGALTRGVEKNVSAPFGDYLDNLWKDTTTSVADTATDTITKKVIDPLKNIPNPLNVFTNPFPSAYAYTTSKPQLPPPTLIAKPTPNAPTLIRPTESVAGWYYQNFAPGGRDDRQINLKSGTADKLKSRGYDLTFLTTSQKLSPNAFTMFGKSKGYL